MHINEHIATQTAEKKDSCVPGGTCTTFSPKCENAWSDGVGQHTCVVASAALSAPSTIGPTPLVAAASHFPQTRC